MTARETTISGTALVALLLVAGCSSGGHAPATTPAAPSPVGSGLVVPSGVSRVPVTGASGSASGSGSAASSSASGPVSSASAPVSSHAAPAPAPASFATFVGTWFGHGRSLVVGAGGAVTVEFRTYTDCTATVTTGCDRTVGDTIVDGGHVVGSITAVADADDVTVTVTSTTVPAQFPAGPFRLGHDDTHHAVAAFTGSFGDAPFCSDASPAGYCGA